LKRRNFLQAGSLLAGAGLLSKQGLATPLLPTVANIEPLVISTWDAGLPANEAAWQILQQQGKAIDAVEAGVMVTENSQNCCVGLGANPDRDGFVTLDASIMDHLGNCGSVAFLEQIKHPIQVARRVMEKTPHVMLVGTGAQQFALTEGFILEPAKLSAEAEQNYKAWLKKSEYKPTKNIENKQKLGYVAPPQFLDNGNYNHDTIGMLALDGFGNLSGSCTTSGQGFKMRGRLGDSPIIGSGLYVDNAVGAAVATGQGEDIIRICGSYRVVAYLEQGYTPTEACKKAIEKLVQLKGEKYCQNIQACFIAVTKAGAYGAYALHPGFTYALRTKQANKLFNSPSLY
jgi:N4-(beta-N-acetylglucosaminyl)-L-asparaginase